MVVVVVVVVFVVVVVVVVVLVVALVVVVVVVVIEIVVMRICNDALCCTPNANPKLLNPYVLKPASYTRNPGIKHKRLQNLNSTLSF